MLGTLTGEQEEVNSKLAGPCFLFSIQSWPYCGIKNFWVCVGTEVPETMGIQSVPDRGSEMGGTGSFSEQFPDFDYLFIYS